MARVRTNDGVTDLEAEIAAADVVVLLQRHKEYDVDALGAIASCLLDTRGVATESDSVTRL